MLVIIFVCLFGCLYLNSKHFGPTDCSDDLFNNMKLYCAKYIRVCKEINISFMPQEAQVSGYSVCSVRVFCNFPFPLFMQILWLLYNRVKVH